MYINKSLTFLEQAIIALGDRRRDHVPFRQSKLTHVLKDSIGGKCNTLLIANIWGEGVHIEETLSTMRFGSRMMNVPSEPAVTEHFDTLRLCKQYEKEIRTLRQELAMHDTLTNRSQISYEPLSESQIQDVREQVKRFLAGELNDIELVNVRQIKETFAQFRVIVNSMESDVEERLREKYVLQERDGATSAAGGKQGTVQGDESGLVGEVDGQGFGVGVAPPGVKPNVSTLVSTRKVKSRGKGKERDSAKSPAQGSAGQNDGQPGSDGQDRLQSPSAQSPTRAATPPPKSEAFEEFKQERGSEINRILNQNKEILREKKKKAKELSSSVNSLMEEINESGGILETHKQERLEQGEFRTDDGQVVIDEDEYELLRNIKDLKSRYRHDYEDLLNTKSEVGYCVKLVNQCRHRLVTEFDNWYSESFLGTDDEPKGGREGQVPEDEQEKFDRLQLELLMEHPDSVPYYNAKMQTERRMHLTASGGQQKKRKPGTLIATVRNKPPTTLTVT
ncbi:Kinesin-like protein kif9 [Desmophyllum pertusum]|uniref:Kinesin-like protein kif9 n=1 Tax=Desmophyllum pertusum TaxID=174260 RepID=A0A9W9ZI61_9CNID|nr:Kinesin-like protein kif9 [Desmophyllum pertusum]